MLHLIQSSEAIFGPILAAAASDAPKNSFQAAAAIAIFLICYVLIAAEKFNKITIVLVGAAAMAMLGITTSSAAFLACSSVSATTMATWSPT
jgi:sugar phosphate permease